MNCIFFVWTKGKEYYHKNDIIFIFRSFLGKAWDSLNIEKSEEKKTVFWWFWFLASTITLTASTSLTDTKQRTTSAEPSEADGRDVDTFGAASLESSAPALHLHRWRFLIPFRSASCSAPLHTTRHETVTAPAAPSTGEGIPFPPFLPFPPRRYK